MKLFYAPGTCSLAPMILAEWLGLPLELERVNPRDPSPEFLAINPLGAVPALELEGRQVFTQVDAILQYFLAVRPGTDLAAGDDLLDQFEVHRWTAFLTGDFHPPFGAWFNPRRFTTDHSEQGLQVVTDAIEARIRTVADVLDTQIGESTNIALGRCTFLDAYAFAMVRWIKKLDGGLAEFPNLQRFMQALGEDPGVQAALSRESG